MRFEYQPMRKAVRLLVTTTRADEQSIVHCLFKQYSARLEIDQLETSEGPAENEMRYLFEADSRGALEELAGHMQAEARISRKH